MALTSQTKIRRSRLLFSRMSEAGDKNYYCVIISQYMPQGKPWLH